jgi:hypothetical protein
MMQTAMAILFVGAVLVSTALFGMNRPGEHAWLFISVGLVGVLVSLAALRILARTLAPPPGSV